MKAIELYRNNDHAILITAIKFSTLSKIVRFTRRELSNWSEERSLIEESDQYYQRSTNENRVKGIKNHIIETLFKSKDNSDVLFPSSLILNMELDLEDVNFSDDFVEFNIPNEKESCLIVDGQHRIKAMTNLFKELQQDPISNKNELDIISNYKFNCTILINYDLWEQARIFANVNFNQKPVDRSLYFDIFGEVPKEGADKNMSNLYVAHELGKYLNSTDKSPLKGFVRDFNSKRGFISQAFLTERILALLGPRSTWNNIVIDYKEDGDLYKKLPKVFVGYFTAIKHNLSDYWPKSLDKKDATLLSKTTGLGGLIRLLGWTDTMLRLGLFPKYDKTDLIDLPLNEITNLYEEMFEKLLQIKEGDKTIAEFYFGSDSSYQGSGSVGQQSQLFKDLAKELGIPYYIVK